MAAKCDNVGRHSGGENSEKLRVEPERKAREDASLSGAGIAKG
jgi:hypothetical protein